MRECPTCGRLFNVGEDVCLDDGAALAPMGEADPLVGVTIGSYRVTRRLGRGGMGSVYVGEHPTIGSTVAIKVLHRKYAADPAIVERFFNEARAVNLIGHENIVRIFDFAHLPDGTPYFIMELLEGRSLSALCGERHPADELAPLFVQLARGLAAAHAAGVVHRDLKPENVFLVDGADGPRVKVLDFGIAKLSSLPGVRHTESGIVLGSARYLSPEQAAGESARVGARSDIYSLGVMLFELACGRVPFDGLNYGDLLLAHRTKQPPPPHDLAADLPRWFEQVILRCLAKDPDDRFASMEALSKALSDRALVEVPAKPRRSRLPILAAAVAGALVVGLAVAGGRRPAPSTTAPVAPMPPRSLVRLDSIPPGAHFRVVQADQTLEGETPAVLELLADVPAVAHLEREGCKPIDQVIVIPVEGASFDLLLPLLAPLKRVTVVPKARMAATIRPPPGPRFTVPTEVGDGMIDVEL